METHFLPDHDLYQLTTCFSLFFVLGQSGVPEDISHLGGRRGFEVLAYVLPLAFLLFPHHKEKGEYCRRNL